MATPGPWTKGKTGECVVNATMSNECGDDNCNCDEHYGGKVICESVFDADDMSKIIAAPDLLAACEEALEVIQYYGYTYPSGREAMVNLETAITKARGQ